MRSCTSKFPGVWEKCFYFISAALEALYSKAESSRKNMTGFHTCSTEAMEYTLEKSGLKYPNTIKPFGFIISITIYFCSLVLKSAGNRNFDHVVRGFIRDHSDLIRVGFYNLNRIGEVY